LSASTGAVTVKKATGFALGFLGVGVIFSRRPT
jgi:hypothetical protein